MSWFVYVARCADGSLYTGLTTDLVRRIDEHNGLKKGGAKYTKMRGPVTLVHNEKLVSRSEASKREYQIKQMSREEKEGLVKMSAS